MENSTRFAPLEKDWQSAEMKAADEKVYLLLDDIKQINDRNSRLLIAYSEKIEENTIKFEKKLAALKEKLGI